MYSGGIGVVDGSCCNNGIGRSGNSTTMSKTEDDAMNILAKRRMLLFLFVCADIKLCDEI